MGRRHDLTIYRQSNLDNELQTKLQIQESQYCIFGDAAYAMSTWMKVAYPRATATPKQHNYNVAMNSARVAVEWSYKDIKQMWATNDYKRMLKVRQAPISMMFKASALLWNFKICLGHGGQVQSYFNCPPPDLETYIINMN